jgi:hypothetical protein
LLQANDTLLGKILRINVNPPFSPGLPYAIPPENPFLSDPAYKYKEVWIFSLLLQEKPYTLPLAKFQECSLELTRSDICDWYAAPVALQLLSLQ